MKVSAAYVLLFLVLFGIAVSRPVNTLYEYEFANSNFARNIGSNFIDEDTLRWQGGSRTTPPDGQGVILNPMVLDNYSSEKEIAHLRSTFLNAKGFDFSMRLKLQSASNYNTDYCLFCVLSSDRKIGAINPCTDLDFGVRLKARQISFNVRSSESDKCDNIEFSVPILKKYIGKSILVRFTYDDGIRQVKIDDEVVHQSIPKKTILNNHDVSIWSTKHIFVTGALKTGSYNTKIQLYSYALGYQMPTLREESTTTTTTSPQTSGSSNSIGSDPITDDVRVTEQTIEVASTTTTTTTNTPKLLVSNAAPGSAGCTFNSCGKCNEPESTCGTFNKDLISFADAQCIHKNTKCLIQMNAPHVTNSKGTVDTVLETMVDIYVDTPLQSIETQTIGALLHCKQPEKSNLLNVGWTLSNLFAREPQDTCKVAHRAYLTKSVSLGDLYECMRGVPRTTLTPTALVRELESLAVNMSVEIGSNGPAAAVYTNTPCGFTILSQLTLSALDLKQTESLAGTEIIQGNVFVASHHEQDLTVKTIELTRYIASNDLYLPFKTCYNARARDSTLHTLQRVRISDQSGPVLSLGKVSQCKMEGASCCHYWNLHTIRHHLNLAQTLYTSVNVEFTVNGRNYMVPVTTALSNVRPASLHHGPRESEVSVTGMAPQDQVEPVMRIFNDPAGTIPFRKTHVRQRVYYRIDIVPRSALPLSPTQPFQCYTPHLTYQVGIIGACLIDDSTIHHTSVSTCKQLGGVLHTILDLTNPYNPVYTRDWQATVPLMNGNCTSSVVGSFLDILTKKAPGVFAGDIIRTPPLHPSFFTAKKTTPHLFQTTSSPKRSHMTSSYVGGCWDGLLPDEDGVCVGYLHRAFHPYMDVLKWFFMFALVALSVYAGIKLYQCFFPHIHVHHKKDREILGGSPLYASYTPVPGQEEYTQPKGLHYRITKL